MKYGVIIGRFQINYPHAGHIQLIERVRAKSDKIIIFIGCSRARLTRNNPLSFEAREKMLLRLYPDAIIKPLYDMKSDIVWSSQLDRKIREITDPNVQKEFPTSSIVTLFGGRDSFISYYHGEYKTETLDGTICDLSATRLRDQIANFVSDSTDWREGVIHASAYKYPISFQTVDIAIVDKDKVLLGRKHDEDLFRFIGGFVDPTDESLEAAALREAGEEAGRNLELADVTYICSHRVNDWRYKKEVDKICTAFFMATYVFGPTKAGDDIAEVRWFNLKEIGNNEIVEEHIPLLEKLLSKLKIHQHDN